jgi:hypothetical protein
MENLLGFRVGQGTEIEHVLDVSRPLAYILPNSRLPIPSLLVFCSSVAWPGFFY